MPSFYILIHGIIGYLIAYFYSIFQIFILNYFIIKKSFYNEKDKS